MPIACLSGGADWTKHYTPCASAIVFPASTEEVQAIVHLANAEKFSLVPSGGRTGLSAGAVAAHGEVVISFDRMNRVLGFYPADRMVQIQAGVVTRSPQEIAYMQAIKRVFDPNNILNPGKIFDLD